MIREAGDDEEVGLEGIAGESEEDDDGSGFCGAGLGKIDGGRMVAAGRGVDVDFICGLRCLVVAETEEAIKTGDERWHRQ